MKRKFIYPIILLISLLINSNIVAQKNNEEIEALKQQLENQKSEVQQLRYQMNNETSQLRQTLNDYASSTMVLFLFGVFCALWAQNTGRNPWTWFFAGFIFSVITAVILLIRNADDE